MTFQPFEPDAHASTNPAGNVPNSHQGGSPKSKARHVVYGTPTVVRSVIATLHHLGYAEPNEWSRLMPSQRPGEVMSILTKTV